MQVTLKDIARDCGLSVTLVSQVLRNPENPKFRPETRQRVLDAACRTNYVPNHSAASLQRGYSRIIALVTPWNMVDIPDAAERTAANAGYQTVVLASAAPSADYQLRAIRLALSLQVDGIIWLPCGTSEDIAGISKLLQSQRIPVLVLERETGALAENWAFLTEDNDAIAELTLRVFPERRRDLFIISSAPPGTENVPLFAALEACAARAGKAVKRFYPQQDYAYDDDGIQLVRLEAVWTRLGEALNTDCDLFCDGDWLVWDLWKIFGAGRLRLPRCAILSFGDFRLGSRGRMLELFSPEVSALRRPFYSLGCQAVQLLLALIAGDPAAHGIHYNRTIELISRQTTRS